MSSSFSILDLVHERLLGPSFPRETWAAWRAFFAALFGLPLDADELALFRRHTGRCGPLEGGYHEAWLVVGRRGGKSLAAALVGIYLAIQDYLKHLSPGERGVVAILAADRAQARVIFAYVRGLLHSCPALKKEIARETASTIDLKNEITIEVATSNFRSIRGRTLVAAILDEVAYWQDETTTNPDVEVVAALRPALSTIPGSRLIGLSSPYARRGVLWERYAAHFGESDSDVLIWQGPSVAMNPTLDAEWIEREVEKDPERNRAEYLAVFRNDVAAFLDRAVVEACVVERRYSLPPLDEFDYLAFVDPSGGRGDAFACAIAHRESKEHPVVVDAVREVNPPFSPEAVVAELVPLLRAYSIREVVGDRYAASWVTDAFGKHGFEYVASELARSALYAELLAMISSGTVELLDHPGVVTQLCSLERRTSSGGRDVIDHPRRGHDDLANAVAGAAWLASQGRARGDFGITLPSGRSDFSREARVHVTQPVIQPPRHVGDARAWNGI